jgi:hypothetical protein
VCQTGLSLLTVWMKRWFPAETQRREAWPVLACCDVASACVASAKYNKQPTHNKKHATTPTRGYLPPPHQMLGPQRAPSSRMWRVGEVVEPAGRALRQQQDSKPVMTHLVVCPKKASDTSFKWLLFGRRTCRPGWWWTYLLWVKCLQL